MRKGWSYKTIEHCFKVKSGEFLPSKNMIPNGPISVYGGNGIAGAYDKFNLEGDNIVIGRVGAKCGNVRYLKERIWLTDNALYISEYFEKFHPKFLEYLLNLSDLRSTANQAAQPVISYSTIKKIVLPVPPFAEQKQIVSVLDKAFAAIDKAKENAEKNLQNAKELFESYAQQAFSLKCETKTLNQISENLDSRRVPITKNLRKAGSIPYYGASGIVDYVKDYIFKGDFLLVSEDGANLLMRTYPIAFSISGKSWVNNHAHILSFDSLITQKFVEYYLNSISLEDYVSGMAQPKLNQAMLNKIPIPFPSLKEQQSVVERLERLLEDTLQLQKIYEQKIANLEELKKSILQKAFSGELTHKEVPELV